MKRMLFQVAAATIVGVGCAFAQTVSVKSPNGVNEIRLMTEPTLSYAVYHAGLERVALHTCRIEEERKGGEQLHCDCGGYECRPYFIR